MEEPKYSFNSGFTPTKRQTHFKKPIYVKPIPKLPIKVARPVIINTDQNPQDSSCADTAPEERVEKVFKVTKVKKSSEPRIYSNLPRKYEEKKNAPGAKIDFLLRLPTVKLNKREAKELEKKRRLRGCAVKSCTKPAVFDSQTMKDKRKPKKSKPVKRTRKSRPVKRTRRS